MKREGQMKKHRQTSPRPRKTVAEEGHVLIRNVNIPIEQVTLWEQNFGGKLVTDNRLSSALQLSVWKYKTEHGVYPDVMHPSDCPGDEFFPVQIKLNVGIGADIDSPWHAFIRRPRPHFVG
jgi:hypothetical protein